MSILVKCQKFTRTRIIGTEKLTVTIRHDDSCGNGHNTFTMTATLAEQLKSGRWRETAWGMQHEEIKKFFPELEPYLKWHLCSTDGPLHYVANTTYHASDKDCWGHRKGEPCRFKTAIRFKDFPITFTLPDAFTIWLQSLEDYNLEVVSVPHDKEPKTFTPKYTFSPYSINTWHMCPFDTKREAREFLQALQNNLPEFISIATAWGEGKEPDIEAAHHCAIWPDATLEQLQDKEALLARLPALMGEFKAAVEALGLVY